MAEQLKLFEDIINNLGKPKQPTQRQDADAQYAKDDRGNSKGAFKNFVKEDEVVNAESKKMMQYAIERSTEKVKGYPKKEKKFYMNNLATGELEDVNNPGSSLYPPKTRLETMPERIDRIQYQFGESDKKPAHLDNPNIIDYENHKKIPKPFKSDDKSTYPSDRDQKQKLNDWDLVVSTATSPAEKNEVRSILREDYKKTKGKYMSQKELRMIGKHPEQLKPIPISTPAPVVSVPMPVQQQIPVAEIIRRKADENLYRQQQQHDMQYGRGGLAALTRPKK